MIAFRAILISKAKDHHRRDILKVVLERGWKPWIVDLNRVFRKRSTSWIHIAGQLRCIHGSSESKGLVRSQSRRSDQWIACGADRSDLMERRPYASQHAEDEQHGSYALRTADGAKLRVPPGSRMGRPIKVRFQIFFMFALFPVSFSFFCFVFSCSFFLSYFVFIFSLPFFQILLLF